MVTWVTALFPEGKPLVYRSTLNEKAFATQWTLPAVVTSEGLVEVESFLEVDMAALGQGGSPHRQRARLLCTADFAPVRYESQSGDKPWSLEFEQNEVVVHPPGGEAEYRVPRGGAQYLFGVTGHEAIAAAILHQTGRLQNSDLMVFAPDPQMAVPYKLSPAPELGDGWIRSSHEEDLLVDGNGLLLRCDVPKRGVHTSIVLPPPELPEWTRLESFARPKIVYTPPADAHFRTEDVTIDGPVTPLGGTLTIPEGEGPFPAVLFLSGSGTHDRHGIAGEIDLGTHEIMDHLAERGFVGLRYDTRGAGTTKFGRDLLDLGVMALVDDAMTCYKFLEQRTESQAGNIFLLGHSQGGTLALVLAARRGVTPRGMVLMASLGRGIDEVMMDQLDSQGKVIGLSEEQIAAQREDLRAFVEIARSDQPVEPRALPDHLLSLVRSRTWLREHLENPATALIALIHCPVLICQGEKDFQVSPERDAKLLAEAARAAGVDVELQMFPDLDHLFKTTEGESRMSQYYDRSRHVSHEVLDILERWLTGHALK